MNTTTKIAVAVLAGAIAGGTCPSDVNNDGTVGIQDFLQVLGDWGPCPSAQVVDLSRRGLGGGDQGFLRLWSDGRIDENVWDDSEGWSGWQTFPAGIAPTPADAHAVAFHYLAADPVNQAPAILVLWSDASLVVNNRDCRPDHLTWCGWEAVPD